MKKTKTENKYNISDIVGTLILVSVISFGAYFTYGLINSYISNDSITSDKVWCANCQTYHDKQTAEEEQQQKLIWCINCNKYHAPDQE